MASATRFAYVPAAFAVVAMCLAACSSEGYDTGDGNYSYLTAELALLHTDSKRAVTAATLDNGANLQLSNPFTIKWAEKPDTVYRALLYYDKPDGNVSTVKVRSVSQVPVLGIANSSQVKEMHTDPVGLESVWTSKNGSYINMSLLLKSGSTSADTQQSIGMVSEGTSVDADGKRRLVLRLYHNQGGVPEYYTVQQYVCIDARSLDADVVEINVNTYNGEVVKVVNKSE